MGWLADETGLEKQRANHVALTPLSHLNRAARIFPDHEALAYGNLSWSHKDYQRRVTQLASALAELGLTSGDVIATLMPSIPAQAETHFAIPAMGGVINTINVRLDVSTVAYILDHGGAKAVLVDSQFIELAEAAVQTLEGPAPILIEVTDPLANHPDSGRHLSYEALLAGGDPNFQWAMPKDEWESSLALNYTSGTTGRPKGVVYSHRGAYLMTMGTVISWQMVLRPRYLTIVPLFHCNGWNHTWMMSVLGGTVVCCRNVTAAAIYKAIAEQKISHFGAAPIVLNAIVNTAPEDRRAFSHRVEVFTAGAPPAAATLAAIEKLGFNVTQVYGLTETYGHVTECLWHGDNWDSLDEDEKATIKARQGVAMPMMEDITVLDATNLQQVPMDGASPGEIAIRGNSVMKGYYKNPKATAESFTGGYFHSGDIALQHPDGYIQITDRAKDIIISGGENVSSVEVEGVLMHHPAVSLCAVVAKPDDKWGEAPCAFVELKTGQSVSAQALIDFARQRLAGFKTPKDVVFQNLPKTSTGKVQKFVLRSLAKSL